MRLQGANAFFPFQYTSLLDKLNKKTPMKGDFQVFWHFQITLKAPLDEGEQSRLEALLGVLAGKCFDKAVENHFWIVPRKGTQSPWSSKATELSQTAGFSSIARIERLMECRYSTEGMGDPLADLLCDRMMQEVLWEKDSLEQHFQLSHVQGVLRSIPLLAQGEEALKAAEKQLALGLSSEELEIVYRLFQRLGRDPTDAELMMFAQANSEHCRHKLFNAAWTIDGVKQSHTLFQMIKETFARSPHGVLSAYADNAAVFENQEVVRLYPSATGRVYQKHRETVGTLIKVETHNHPTAISPYPGAATGVGGELRDEGAVGRGGKPKAGLQGFSVSDLQLEGWRQPWEVALGKPSHISAAAEMMQEAPLGSAAYGNEFGRPTLCGYFRTYTQKVGEGSFRGYHKPIMIAGGMGNIEVSQVQKKVLPAKALLIVLGGPSFLIGLGGGAASSRGQGEGESDLDFASVQRDNPEMERRCQEVIDCCARLKEQNPILSIHDVGAGGLSNALTELVHDSQRGASLVLQAIPSADPTLSPMALWCNESQERYVLGILEEDLARFTAIAERERAPFAVVGTVTTDPYLHLRDTETEKAVIDLKLIDILGVLPQQQKHATRQRAVFPPIQHVVALEEVILRLLHLPAIADKSFLITIADRTVTGLVARDQMVGPWQIPVSDVAVTLLDYEGYAGDAMAMGERSPVAVWDPVASVQLAVGEAITNMMAADIEAISDIRLSCNWMAASGHAADDADLYAAVKEVGLNLCPALGICVPVGKDSLSMKSTWTEEGKTYTVAAPVSLVVSAFAKVKDVRKTLTPVLQDSKETVLLLIDLGETSQALGGSCYAQVTSQLAGSAPRLPDPQLLKQCFEAVRALRKEGHILAYHDRSDGGVFITLVEMAFAGHVGLDITVKDALMESLFYEGLGVVVQVQKAALPTIENILKMHGLAQRTQTIATLNETQEIRIFLNGLPLFQEKRSVLQQAWSRTSLEIQLKRDNPETARRAYAALLDETDPGLDFHLPSSFPNSVALSTSASKPRVAILREQGVNGHFEMAAAFTAAGFEAFDVTMHDLLKEPTLLASMTGLAACGGFSYGDVLGAGTGWAKGILFHDRLRAAFQSFFERPDTFSLGVCNGCQLLSQLKILIPGAEGWPSLLPNVSGRFEARLSLVEILESPSIVLKGMEGARLPIAVAHGEGRIVTSQNPDFAVCLQYIDNWGHVAHAYPSNPNGSTAGITGFCSTDGRVTALMPHPERVFKTAQLSWYPESWQAEYSPWMQLFQNARRWVR